MENCNTDRNVVRVLNETNSFGIFNEDISVCFVKLFKENYFDFFVL